MLDAVAAWRLSHQRYAGRRLNRQNYSSTAGWRAYCGGGPAMALAARAGIPLDVMYDVVTHAAELTVVRKPYAACR